jgi:hypothetical protein
MRLEPAIGISNRLDNHDLLSRVRGRRMVTARVLASQLRGDPTGRAVPPATHRSRHASQRPRGRSGRFPDTTAGPWSPRARLSRLDEVPLIVGATRATTTSRLRAVTGGSPRT